MNYEFNFLTDYWEGKLQYGEFIGESWLGLGGPEHPVMKKIISEIQQIPNIDHFDVFILGGILEDWITWDLDLVVTGELKHNYLQRILRDIAKIGFDNKFYIDAVFKEKLWRIDLMTLDNTMDVEGWVWEYSNFIKKNDKLIQKFKYYPQDGLFKRYYYLPFPKHIEKLEQGYRYKKPVQIVVKKEL